MDRNELKSLWEKDEKMGFQGWDFSYLHGRWEEENLPWDYAAIVKKYLKPQHRLLDMGTGGGEFLLSLGHPYDRTSVTEAWEPNVRLCREKLAPLGICVRQVYSDSELPFEAASFDIIINRHEAYDVREVGRLLKPDGIFITQQVGGENDCTLSKRLIRDFSPRYPQINLHNALEELRQNAFEAIYEGEYHPYLRFYDVGAVVYFAKIIEWEFPGFSVEGCFDELCRLQEELGKRPYIESLGHRFIIAAKKGS